MSHKDILEILSHVHLEDIGESDAPSVYINTPEYKIIKFRLLNITSSGLSYNSLTYLLVERDVYRVSGISEVEKLAEGVSELHQQISNQLNLLYKIVDQHINSIELLEDRVFSRTKSRSILNEIFEHKKSLMKLGRVFDRLSIVLKSYLRSDSEVLSNILKELTDTIEDAEVHFRMTKSQIEKLNDIYNYYTSVKNDNLNKNIYILSIISGIFLPLNLIVGFFGMNTNGLFLANNQQGTTLIFYIIVSIFVLMLLGLPVLHFLDKLIVSKLFGRYKLYSQFSKHIENLNDDYALLDKK